MKVKKGTAISRKVACIGLTAVMASTFVAGQLLAFADGKSPAASEQTVQTLSFKNANGKVDLSQIKIDNLNKQAVENTATASYDAECTVIVTLSGKSLSERAFKSAAAKEDIENEQAEFLADLSKKKISYTLRSSYSSVINAVALDLKLSDAGEIKSMYGVKSVTVSPTYAVPKTAEGSGGSSLDFSNITENSIYENGIYNSAYQNVSKGYNGTGMQVAILDTGLDYTHSAFAEENMINPDADGYYTKEYVESLMTETEFKAAQRTGAKASDVYISQKVPFAYDYSDNDADVYPSYSQHGTHVAGIVAGKDEENGYKNKDGNQAVDANGEKLPFLGVAPEAQLVICKVFSDDLDNPDIGGAEAVNIIDALEDCYNLGVDVINMSLGTSCGFSSSALGYDEEGVLMDRVYTNIRTKGISLIVAASNEFSAGYGGNFGTNLTSNPDSGTVGSPSTFSGAMSVASINGQLSPYFMAKADDGDEEVPIFYEESRNEDSDAFNFLGDMLGLCKKDGVTPDRATVKYVVAGRGESGDYLLAQNEFKNKKEGEVVVAVVSRGGNTFKDKVSAAKTAGADGVIVYNNVSGMVRMSLGDLNPHVPAISVSLEDGLKLVGTGANRHRTGTLTFDTSYLAGPFMNDYSSWGVTPDLQLKPDVTSHGGEITSTVAGGYAEMSGTSMACPNLAGFTALFRSYLENECRGEWYNAGKSADENAVALTHLTNNIVMSTARIVYDRNALPYSPRKQGAGLATLKNVFNTGAYLYTDEADGMCEDGRPKAELGEDAGKAGEYTVKFHLKNFGTQPLEFTAKSIFMTETVGKDGKSVAEEAYLLGQGTSNTTWKVNGSAVKEGDKITAAAGADLTVEVKLSLTKEDKAYLNDNFDNGMFVEGFLQLEGSDGQCDLSLPFMGFYGSWKDAPMMDRTCFEVAATERLSEEKRVQPSIWATQAYGYYANEKYTIPLGSFLYLQDPAKEHTSDYIYVEEEHTAISRDFHEFYGDNSPQNYYTTSGIKALYAGLLRYAEVVTYKLTDVYTGEVIRDEEIYRVGKSVAAGGSPVPSQVLMELRTEELGVQSNGKYRLDFEFYFSYDDYKNGTVYKDEESKEKYGVYKNNVFSMNFYVDYEAPVLEDARVTFMDRQNENNEEIAQKVTLELDVFDNHYPQAVILCYSDSGLGDKADTQSIKLATPYITPVLNPERNTTNTVTIDITDFYEKFGDGLWVELDDYALNNNLYYIYWDNAKASSTCPENFNVTYNGEVITEITVEKNVPVKLSVDNLGNANVSNFIWNTGNPLTAAVKNGELVGLREGTTTLSVRGGNGVTKRIEVKVTDNNSVFTPASLKNIYFGAIINSDNAPAAATDKNGLGTTVQVNPGQKFRLEISADPWYYPLNSADASVRPKFIWKSSDETVATVDQNGNVEVLYEDPDYTRSVQITAEVEGNVFCVADVTLEVVVPYKTTNGALTKYSGRGISYDSKGNLIKSKEGYNVLQIPKDMAVTSVAEEAFKDNTNVEVIIFPKSVTTIEARAFEGCTNLKKICFISEDAQPFADSSLNIISRYAFKGCTSFETLDLSNCKVITIDKFALEGCTSLKTIKKPEAIGTLYAYAFKDCTSLEEVDISSLHVAGAGAFAGCTKLSKITTSKTTAMSAGMFAGCTSLEEVVINCPAIPAAAFGKFVDVINFEAPVTFEGCSNLKKVTVTAKNVTVGAGAFANCSRLADFVIAEGATVSSLGSGAFSMCTSLKNDTFTNGTFGAALGADVFNGVSTMNAAIKSADGTKLYLAPAQADATVLNGVTEIAPYAFSRSTVPANTAFDLSGVTKIGEGAFSSLFNLKSVVLPANLTAIPARAFYGCAGLESVTIPATVTSIGTAAFAGCTNLTVDFSTLTALKTVGANAFEGSGVTEVSLPASLTELGDEAFARCAKLTTVSLAAVEKMGTAVFALAPKLKTVSFGAGVKTTGEYTFTTRRVINENYEESVESVLDTVTFDTRESGAAKPVMGEGAFAYSVKLAAVDLSDFDEVGAYAFYGCIALKTVNGLDKLKVIGECAFANCVAIEGATLTAAEKIGFRAFLGDAALATVTFGEGLKAIGAEAFSECAIAAVAIPASCESVGTSAFAGNLPHTAYSVAEGNEAYFVSGGVLYRYITGSTYELIAYPTGKVSAMEEGGTVRTYEVIEGTVAIHDWAFYYSRKVETLTDIPSSGRVQKVKLPYTLKTIGDGAFYASGITEYFFESINAPALLENIRDRVLDRNNSYSSNSFYYNNFNDYLANVTKRFPTDIANRTSNMIISYPSNGVGYTNFVYGNYFGSKVVLSEYPTDESRQLRDMLIEMKEVLDEIASWTTTKTREQVEEFSKKVTQAHILYNGLETQAQRDWITQEYIDVLFTVEDALKPVKAAHGIVSAPMRVEIDASSAHRKDYKEGDSFSMAGLKLLITLEDYSQEVIDAAGNFTVSGGLANRALRVSDSVVNLDGTGKYAGLTARVQITVAEAEAKEDGGSKGLSPAITAVIAVACVVVVLGAAAAVVFVLIKKGVIVLKKKEKTSGADEESTATDGEDEGGVATGEADGNDTETATTNGNDTETAAADGGSQTTDETAKDEATSDEKSDNGEQDNGGETTDD